MCDDDAVVKLTTFMLTKEEKMGRKTGVNGNLGYVSLALWWTL